MVIITEHEQLLGRESPYSHILQLSCLIIFLCVWIVDSFVLKFSVVFADYAPWWIRLIMALTVILIGFIIVRLAEKELFHQKQEKPAVIDTGIQMYARHPLYLGVLFVYAGFVLVTFSLLSLVTYILIFIVYDYLATFEENDLERVFGKAYLEYKSRVPKWIPRFSSK